MDHTNAISAVWDICFNPDGSQMIVAVTNRVLVYDAVDANLLQVLCQTMLSRIKNVPQCTMLSIIDVRIYACILIHWFDPTTSSLCEDIRTPFTPWRTRTTASVSPLVARWVSEWVSEWVLCSRRDMTAMRLKYFQAPHIRDYIAHAGL